MATDSGESNSIVITINGMYSAIGLDDDASVALRVFEPDEWLKYGRVLGYALRKAQPAQVNPDG